MSLDDRDLAELAERLAEELVPRLVRSPLVTAKALATILDVEEDWVREHGAELGGRRLGTGPKAPWRFDVEDAIASLPCPGSRGSKSATVPVAARVEPHRRRQRRRRLGTGSDSVPAGLVSRGRRVV